MSTISIEKFAPATGIYDIDAVESRIEFDTKHLFGLGKVRGTFALIELAGTAFENTAEGFTATAEGVIDRYHHHITAAKGLAGRWLSVKITIVAKVRG